MGRKQKFLLLAVIILRMQAESYSYSPNYTGKSQIIKTTKEVEITTDKNKEPEKIEITGERWFTVSGGTLKNSGKIEVNNSKNMMAYLGYGNLNNEGEIKFTGTNTGIQINGGIVSNGTVNKSGKIYVNNGIGILVKNGENKTSSFENKKDSSVVISNTATGIVVGAETSTVINNGIITSGEKGEKLTSGTGLKIEGGEFINNNEITLEKNHSEAKGNAIFQSGGILTNNGTITISTNISIDPQKDENGYGINQAGGTIDNLGTLNIKATGEKSIGMNQVGTLNNLVSDGKSGKIVIEASGENSVGIKSTGTITNTGEIKVNASGKNGVGIHLNDANARLTNGSADSAGTITVTSGTGIKISNGTFTNLSKNTIDESGKVVKQGLIVQSGTGIELQGGNAVNTGDINVIKGTGVKVSKGTFTNEKEGNLIVTSGNAIYQNGGESTNNGTINVSGNGNGINITNGTAKNEGIIKVTNGIGVKISSTGTFTNSAKNITNENGEIIEQQGLIVQGGTGILQTGGAVSNSGSINISQGAIGLNLQGGTFTNENTGEIVNAGSINISSQKDNYVGIDNKGTIINTGEIEVNASGRNGVGIHLNDANAILTNGSANSTGTITVTSGTGVKVSKGTLTNEKQGKITVTGGNGTYQTGGKIINKGTVTVTKGNGFQLKDGIVTNEGKLDVQGGTGILQKGGTVNTTGTILATKGTGVTIEGGITNNGGNIEVSNGKAGILLNGSGTFNNSYTNSENKLEQKGIIKVSGVNSKGIQFGANGGTADNAGTIEVTSGGIGAYFGGNGTFTNKKDSNIIVSGKVVEQLLKEDGTPDLDENGKQKEKITASKGIFLNSKGVAINEGNILAGYKVDDTGKIVLGEEGAIGVHVNNANAQFTNNANIIVADSSQGIQVNNGLAKNDGKIEAVGTNAAGIYLNGKDGKFENKEKAQILVSGVGAKGIQFGTNGGTADNAGTIEVTSGGIGVYFGGKGTFNNSSNVLVSGKNSKGIYLNSQGITTNAGNIHVGYMVNDEGKIVLGEEGATGVQVNNANAKFTNNANANIIVADSSQGIQVNNGLATNAGNITATGTNAAGIYMNGKDGKFENTNEIIVSGESSKGIFFGVDGGTSTNNGTINVSNEGTGVFSYKGNLEENNPSKNQNNFTNGKGGVINVSGEKTVGLLLDTLNDKGKVVNEGTINVENQGIGVKLGGTTFTNSGTIEVKDTGIAIESVKDTNNTVVLKNGASVVGNIKGNTGVDVLAVEGGSEYKNLAITDYDKIVSLKNSEKPSENAIISNSNISLEFNEGTKDYTNAELNGDKTGLTITDSNIIVDLKNRGEKSSALVDTGDGELKLAGNIKLAFMSGNGQKEFNVSEILGDEVEIGEANFGSSAKWEYTKDKDGNFIAREKSYIETVGKSQLEDFGKVLEQNESIGGDFGKGLTLLGLLDASQFTDAMTQLSGGVHGYTVDFAAINSRNLSNTIKNRELRKDRLRDKALNSYDQEVAYIKNNHKIGGLMNVDYNEEGALGITEKQIMPNGKFGLVFGGSKGKADFENGKHGKASMDNLYLGGYYAYDFSDKLTLVSNANFVYSHTNVTRNIKFAKDNQYLDYSYESTYPVFGFGGGATLYYTPYSSTNNSVTLYGGIDWTKIVQGNINENPDEKEDKTKENLTVKNIPVDEHMYDSVVPHIGLSLSNNGYIFDRKYRLGVNVDYETELGNIKDEKKLKLSALNSPHRVVTTERENIVSYSLNGALDLTENFTIYGNYTKADSDEYDAEKVEAGFKYKMDRMSDLFVTAPLLSGIENSRPYSNRWTGMFSVTLDGTEDSNRSYYTEKTGEHSRGDYATSFKMKPKFTLNLNDRETNWSYYFETYYSRNDMFTQLDHNERRSSESRIHGEARWLDQYSKGKYGFNIGYRNETSSSPVFSQYLEADRQKKGTHQFRFTPNFTYNLGNGFVFGGQTTGILAYEYEGERKGQTDFELENEYGITYNGLMPKWRFAVNYFREDTWYDDDFTKKARLNPQQGVYVYDIVEGERRYQSNQLRPRVTYFFGNGGRVELSARIPLGNGGWYNSDDQGKKGAEKYETRYGLKYYQPITPGLTGMIGGEILTVKTKNTDHSSSNYGKETRDYSIRPAIGISYNF